MSARRLLAFALALAAGGPVAAAQEQPQAVAAPDQPARAARALPRGTIIAADDIMVLGDSVPAELPIGWITRRVVQPGEALRPPAIGRTPVVHTGRAVTIIAGSATVRIVRTGAALEDGAPGDTIRIRFDRGAMISAVVRDSNTVVPVTPSRP